MLYRDIRHIKSSLEKLIKENLLSSFSNHSKEGIDSVLNNYNSIASMYGDLSRSLANPVLYFDAFKERLYNFNYLQDSTSIVIRLPDVDNFNWIGLEVLQVLSEGVVGEFYEVPEPIYYKLLESGISFDIKDELNSLDFFNNSEEFLSYRFKLIKADIVDELNKYLSLDNKLVRFPFSNSASVNLFEGIEDLFEKNIENWIDKTLNEAITGM